MTSGSSGSTSALASGAARDRTPKAPAVTGAVATCAATVTANGSTSRRGPGRCAAIGDAKRRMPAVPRKESWKPTSVATAGWTASRRAEQSPSSANECGRRPSRPRTSPATTIKLLRTAAAPAPLRMTYIANHAERQRRFGGAATTAVPRPTAS